MTTLRSRRFPISLLAALALLGAACSDSAEETGNGAMGSSGDVSDGASGDEQSQPGDGSATNAGPADDTELPPESETGIGDDPANGGAGVGVDEPDPVVESADGLSTEPVGGGVDSTGNDGVPAGPDMPPTAAEFCAVVEFGYISLLEGAGGTDIQDRLREGATTAAASEDQRYSSAGNALLEAVGTDTMPARADALLEVCAEDGFERLA